MSLDDENFHLIGQTVQETIVQRTVERIEAVFGERVGNRRL